MEWLFMLHFINMLWYSFVSVIRCRTLPSYLLHYWISNNTNSFHSCFYMEECNKRTHHLLIHAHVNVDICRFWLSLERQIMPKGHWFGALMLKFEERRMIGITSEGQVNIIMAKCRWEGKRSIDNQNSNLWFLAGRFSKIMPDENCLFMSAFELEARESLVSPSYFWNNPK